MLSSLSLRERRIVLGGCILLVLGVLVTRVIPGWMDWTHRSRNAASVAVLDLNRARAAVAALPELRDSLVARNGRYVALAPIIVSGDTPGTAAASLASLVSGTVAAAGLQMGAIQARVDTTRSAMFGRPTVRGDARGDVRGLVRFLEDIEQHPTLMSVRQLSVSQPEPGAPPDRPEALRIEFVIEGLALDRTVVEARLASERQRKPAHLGPDADGSR